MTKKFPRKKLLAVIAVCGGTQAHLALAMGKSKAYVKAMFYYEHVPGPAREWLIANYPLLFTREDFPDACSPR